MIIREILETAGIDFRERENNEVYLNCPFCPSRGQSEDNRQRLGVNLKSGLGHCFNCGWASRDLMRTARELCEAYGLDLRNDILRRGRKEAKEQPVEVKKEDIDLAGLPPEYEPITGNLDSVGDRARRYLASRGVSVLQIVRHRIGFAGAGDMAWRVLFPVIDAEGLVHGVVGRAFGSNMRPRYLNSRGMKLLWNAQRQGAEAVVVEGVMDALAVERALLSMRNTVAVARLGSVITVEQMNQYARSLNVTQKVVTESHAL